MDPTKCSNADIDWYMKMPTISPPAGPKVEMSLKLWKEEYAILKPLYPMTDN